MLKKENIKMILESVRIDWDKCDEKDIAFAILCDALEDKTLAYRLAYRKSEKDAAKFYETPRFKKLLDVLEPFGIGNVNAAVGANTFLTNDAGQRLSHGAAKKRMIVRDDDG